MANSTLSPEEQLPDEQVAGPDPLQQLGYNEATTPAEQPSATNGDAYQAYNRLNRNVEDIQKAFRKDPPKPAASPTSLDSPNTAKSKPSTGGSPPPTHGGGAKQAVNMFKKGKEKFGAAQDRAKKVGKGLAAAKDLKEHGVEDIKAVAKEAVKQRAKQAAKDAAKRAAKAAGQALKKVVLQIATKNPIALAIIGIILVILIIVVILFVLFGLSGKDSGGGLPVYPSTQTQQEQATLLAALSGDAIANNKTVAEVIKDEKDRYGRIKANAQKYSNGDVAAIDQKIAEFTPLLDSLLSVADKAGKRAIQKDLMAKMLAFEGTLPFGQWITEIALTRVKDPNANFCKITGAGANVACASFTSTTLWDAGVPNAIVGTTTALWSNKSLRIVIDRAPTASNSRINESVMRAGDVVWFGHGDEGRKRYAGALFDHVGIYIGKGEIVDSSGDLVIKRRPLTTHSFNGAKRYGKD